MLKGLASRFQTCKHVAVELFQFERVVMEFLDHFSRLINAMLASHFPETRKEKDCECVDRRNRELTHRCF